MYYLAMGAVRGGMGLARKFASIFRIEDMLSN
jgi:hypothetical protein